MEKRKNSKGGTRHRHSYSQNEDDIYRFATPKMVKYDDKSDSHILSEAPAASMGLFKQPDPVKVKCFNQNFESSMTHLNSKRRKLHGILKGVIKFIKDPNNHYQFNSAKKLQRFGDEQKANARKLLIEVNQYKLDIEETKEPEEKIKNINPLERSEKPQEDNTLSKTLKLRFETS